MIAVAFAVAAARQLLVSVDWVGDALPGDSLYALRVNLLWLASFVHLPAPDAKGVIATPMDQLGGAAFEWAEKGVLGVALKQLGGMTLMLGMMKIVEQGGGLAIMAKVIRPLMVRLFPDVPGSHPAMGAMILNLSANALGLGNAATPFGLKAMTELDKLNPHKGTATNSMALFLAINTSGVTILATGVVVLRKSLGSGDPAGIIGTTLFATSCSTIAAVIFCKAIQGFFATPPASNPVEAWTPDPEADASYPAWVTAVFLASVALFMPLSILYASVITPWLMPTILLGFVSFGYIRGVPVYEAFIAGAREGFDIVIRIIPYLVGILACVGMITASGAMDLFAGAIGPFTAPLGLPAEALPMALIRPLSGSGASGVLAATLANPATGPDTYTGYLVSTIAGSTETTFYVLSLYFGSVGVKNIRHALACGLVADLFGLIGSVVGVQAYFWYAGLS
jgi:spore maturation protein SpmA